MESEGSAPSVEVRDFLRRPEGEEEEGEGEEEEGGESKRATLEADMDAKEEDDDEGVVAGDEGES